MFWFLNPNSFEKTDVRGQKNKNTCRMFIKCTELSNYLYHVLACRFNAR